MLKSIFYLVFNRHFMMAAKKKQKKLLGRGVGVGNLIHIEEDWIYEWPSTYHR